MREPCVPPLGFAARPEAWFRAAPPSAGVSDVSGCKRSASPPRVGGRTHRHPRPWPDGPAQPRLPAHFSSVLSFVTMSDSAGLSLTHVRAPSGHFQSPLRITGSQGALVLGTENIAPSPGTPRAGTSTPFSSPTASPRVATVSSQPVLVCGRARSTQKCLR